MIQSWENFMSPSGGTMDNTYVDGMGAFAVDVGGHLAYKYLLDPIRKSDVRSVRSRMVGKARSILARPQGIGRGQTYSDYMMGRGAYKNTHLNPAFSQRLRSRTAAINQRYGKIQRGVKALGWGYVALASAQIVEALTTPGVNRLAQENDAAAMGLGAPLDSSQAYTQRQRALMAIHDSQLGIRNVLGSEAGYMHR